MLLPSKIDGLMRADHIPDSIQLAAQAPQPRVPPRLVYPGQDLAALKKGLDYYDPDPEGSFPLTRRVSLDLRTVHDATFLLGDGLDGVIVLANGQAIEEPSCFSTLGQTGQKRDISEIPLSDEVFEDIFVGFDGAWGNYYHWMLYALGKPMIALDRLPPGCRIAIPDYESRKASFRLVFSQTTYEQSIAAAGIAAVGSAEVWERDWITRLKPGRYRARRIHFLWTEPRLPTDIFYADAFYTPFARMRAALKHRPDLPRRLMISRQKALDTRIGEADQSVLSELAEAHGFVRVFFEDMSFEQQATALFNADYVIAPHGAGLCNLLFGRDTLRVLELNSDLDGAGYVRACFYQLAVQRGQTYMFLNGSVGDFAREKLEAGIRLLIDDTPSA